MRCQAKLLCVANPDAIAAILPELRGLPASAQPLLSTWLIRCATKSFGIGRSGKLDIYLELFEVRYWLKKPTLQTACAATRKNAAD